MLQNLICNSSLPLTVKLILQNFNGQHLKKAVQCHGNHFPLLLFSFGLRSKVANLAKLAFVRLWRGTVMGCQKMLKSRN